MKHILLPIFLIFFPVVCFANSYEVVTEVDQFMVYDNEPVLIDVRYKTQRPRVDYRHIRQVGVV